MDIQPDLKQFYGKQTVEGAAWPNVSESALELFAESLIQKTCHEIRNDVIPLKSGAMLNLADWDGVSGRAAVQQASQIIDSYESIAAIAELIAISKAMRAAKVVVDTKHAVNSLADEVEKTCQSYLAASAAMSKLNQTEAANLFLRLIGWTVAWGRGINTATVASNAASLAQDLGVPPGSAPADGKLPQPASSPQTPIAPATDPSIPP